MTDELPQSAAGRTIMTTEPKFVPAKAAKIAVSKGADASVRLVDCVGFAVEGAVGFEEEGAPRLIHTPWQDEPMPFEQAAETGTIKVIREHSTVGVLVTTDGTVTDIERKAYVPAEERTVAQLKAIGKPFVIVLNCKDAQKSEKLRVSLEEKYAAPVVAVNVEKMTETELVAILQKALFEFPVTRIDVCLPDWLRSLPETHWAVAECIAAIKSVVPSIKTMRDCFTLQTLFDGESNYCNPDEIRMELGTGSAEITINAKTELFYGVLSKECGEELGNDLQLLRYVRQLSSMKESFEKLETALAQAQEKGYGIVEPTQREYRLQKPKLVKRSAGYGVQFKADAPSYHIIKVDVKGEISPIIGTKQQSEEFVDETLRAYENDDNGVWETNIFGKSLRALVKDELEGKGGAVPSELRKKLQKTASRIVNEGKSNLFCFLF
ncbi:MAG: stage IV sporulation protein A [Clostridia bacterium]|nr:stage IV sporulation protein A [Clostridia bacterium]